MASGMADYSSIIRPKYGKVCYEEGSIAVLANDITGLCTVSGKGMIYGGLVWLDHTSTQANCEVRPIIDGQFLSNLSFVRLMEYGIVDSRSWLLCLLKYDAENYIYSVGISYGVTFEEWLMLSYKETHGQTPTVHWRLCYALI